MWCGVGQLSNKGEEVALLQRLLGQEDNSSMVSVWDYEIESFMRAIDEVSCWFESIVLNVQHI